VELNGNFNPKEIFLEARIIKADGTVIELGTVGYYNRNPLLRWFWKLLKKTNRNPNPQKRQ
jgi:hypothetical protein